MDATTQIFLRVQVSENEDSTVKGEALVEGYADRMLVDGFSFGMTSKLQSPDPDVTNPPDNCDFGQLTVDKVFDRSSARLARLLKPTNDGKGPPPILWEVRITLDQQLVEEGQGFKSGTRKTQNAIMVLHLFKARLVDYKLNATEEKASATVKEALTFTFQNVSVEYYHKGETIGADNSDYKGDMSGKARSDYRDTWLTFDTEYDTQHDEH